MDILAFIASPFAASTHPAKWSRSDAGQSVQDFTDGADTGEERQGTPPPDSHPAADPHILTASRRA